jgi:FlaA1/EpsC-like NDP-sugar epimerase
LSSSKVSFGAFAPAIDLQKKYASVLIEQRALVLTGRKRDYRNHIGRREGRLPMFDIAVLQGKRILVTGGGTGLGKEMAVGFAAHGAHVYICGRRKEVLDQAAREIRERSG